MELPGYMTAGLTVGGVLFLIAAAWAQIRSGGAAGLKDSNEILRGQVQDQKEEMVRLKKEHKEESDKLRSQHLDNVKEIGELKGKLDQMVTEKSKLEDLIIRSLDVYWKANPSLAGELTETIHTEKRTTITPPGK